jgi:alpha-L-fucosidase
MNIYEKFEELRLMPYGPIPNERQMEWYNREMSAFFHFGMNTFTDKEWGDGTESPEQFNPTELDVRQWVRTIKEAGFKCAILTAKHHDGFCLFQTRQTEHSIKNSPYKNGKGDVVDEFIKACEEYGIKAGLYISPWDRHEKTWGTDDYNDFYEGHLVEMILRYKNIWEIWWDGAGSTEAEYDWDMWAYYIRSSFPNAVIFGSLGATPYVDVRWVGNEKGIAGKPCYATIDESSLVYEYTSELNSGKVDGECFIPAEVDVSIRPGWFYHKDQDDQVRSPENLMKLWFSSVGSNTGLLLNIPPDRRGLLHENDVASLMGFKKLLDKSFEKNSNYQKIVRFGDKAMLDELKGYLDNIKERNQRLAQIEEEQKNEEKDIKKNKVIVEDTLKLIDEYRDEVDKAIALKKAEINESLIVEYYSRV